MKLTRAGLVLQITELEEKLAQMTKERDEALAELREGPPTPPPVTMIHNVKVTHKHEPRPRPDELCLAFQQDDGREFLVPIPLYGQSQAWVTVNGYQLGLPNDSPDAYRAFRIKVLMTYRQNS
jgi:hypothetical protein